MKSLLALASTISASVTAVPVSDPLQAEIAAIVAKCGVPQDRLRIIDGRIKYAPEEEDSYESAMCAFNEVQKRDPTSKRGFVASPRLSGSSN